MGDAVLPERDASIGVINAGSSGTPCGAPSGTYCREVPDVSALAGPFPYLEYVSGSWGAWGGTSLAAPLWASLVALSNASDDLRGQGHRVRQSRSSTGWPPSDPSAFNDVTTGDNDLTGRNGGTYPALAGYDMATGLGTPNAARPARPALRRCVGQPGLGRHPGTQSSHLDAAVSLQIRATDATAGPAPHLQRVGPPTGTLDRRHQRPDLGNGRPAMGDFAVAGDGPGRHGSRQLGGLHLDGRLAITSADHATAMIGQPFSFTVGHHRRHRTSI